LTLTQIFFL